MASYQEKLKDPRWQKKRLEILSRDDFTCQHCKDKTNTLTVHHIFYRGYIDPWEYEDHTMIALCYKCHKVEHESYRDECFSNRKHGLTNHEFNWMLLEFFHRINSPFDEPSRYTIMFPKRITFAREAEKKKFDKQIKNSFLEWISEQSIESRLESYEAHKKNIGKEFLTHIEYEDKIKKLAEKLDI